MLLRMIGEINVSRDRFRCVVVVFLRLTKVFSNRSPSRLPVSPMYNRVQVRQWMTLAEVQVKWSVIVMDRLGPDIFLTLVMKGLVLHRARAHLKVPGRSLVWNALLIKIQPMFLSRLNEINGGCEKILPVSGSFWSNLRLFRMMHFTAWLWGWNVSVNGNLSLFFFHWDDSYCKMHPNALTG